MADTLNWRLNFTEAGLKPISSSLSKLQGQINQLQGSQGGIDKLNTSLASTANNMGAMMKNFTASTNKLLDSFKNLTGGAGGGSGGGLGALANAAGGASGAIGGLAGALGSGGLTMVIGVVIAGIGKLGEAFKEFVDEAIVELAKKQRVERTFGQFLGDEKLAKKEYADTARFSQKTALRFDELLKAKNVLIGQGMRGDALHENMKMLADLGAADPNGKQGDVMFRGAQLVARISESGINYVRTGDVTKQASTLGINQGQFIKALAQVTGKSTTREVLEELRDKDVHGNDAIKALQMAVMANLHTSKLGDFAKIEAGTVSGMQSNLGEAQQNVIRSIDEESLPSWVKYEEILSKLNQDVQVFGDEQGNLEGTPKEIQKTASTLVDFGLELKTGFLAGVEEFITVFTTAFNAVTADSESAGVASSGFADSMRILGAVLGSLGAVAGVLYDVFQGLFIVMKACVWIVWGVVAAIDVIAMSIAETIGNIFIWCKNLFMAIADMVMGIVHFSYTEMKKGIAAMSNLSKGTNYNVTTKTAKDDFGALWNDMKDTMDPKKPQNKIKGRGPTENEDILPFGEKKSHHKGAGGGAGAGQMEVFWTPNFGFMTKEQLSGYAYHPMLDSHLATALHADKSMKGSGGAAHSILPSGEHSPHVGFHAMPPAPRPVIHNRNELIINIDGGHHDTNEIVQKVKIEFTKIFGRITANPGPGVV